MSTDTDLLASRFPAVFAYNGGIGDRLCNLPALRALCSLFRGRLALICAQGDRELYYSDLDLRAVYAIELMQTDTGWIFDATELACRMGTCDLLLCINPWHTRSVSELLAKFGNVESVGFFPEFRRHLTCDYYGHAMDMAFAVPVFLSDALRLRDFSQPPAISLMASLAANQLRQRLSISRRTIFVHSETKKEKSWITDGFDCVLQSFLRECPEFAALRVDSHGVRIEAGRFDDRTMPVRLSLDASFALLRDSDMFLGIDSCHLHAADLFRIPGVGLFGPTSCLRWGFKFSNHWHLQGRGRMDTIHVEDVCKALRTLVRLEFGFPPDRSSHSRAAPIGRS